MQVFASDAHRKHHSLEMMDGRLAPSVESPDRADMIAIALRDEGYASTPPTPVDPTLLASIHTPDYLDFLSTAWDRWCEQDDPAPAAMPMWWPMRGESARRPDDLMGQLGFHSQGSDCSIGAATWAAAYEAAGIAQSTATAIIDGETAYGLCRPPGHHANADQFGGYCFLNNSAIAAQHLRDRGVPRVAILDVDYHHGNGTQAIFAKRDDVLTISIHADPMFEFPWFSGHADETGTGLGAGFNRNLPLPRGTDAPAWGLALDDALDEIRDFGAESLVIAFGVDTFVNDPLGHFTLDTADYTRFAADIASLQVPAAIIQEGGYAVADLGTNVVAFLRGFA